MARLTCAAGTIVHADGDLEAKLRLQGWTDPVAAPEVDTQDEETPDEDAPADPPAPAKRGPGRPRKSE